MGVILWAVLMAGCDPPAQDPQPTAEASPAAAELTPAVLATEPPSPIPTPDEATPTPPPAPSTPTADPASPTLAPTVAAPTAASSRVRVAGTEGQGANLRQEPAPEARVLRVLPEGTDLTLIGPDREVGERIWRNVRDDEGTGGWVAAEVLQVVLPTPTPTAADIAAPCRVGQLKGDATAGVYYLPDHADYRSIRERVRCFDSESQARAAGYRAP